MAYVIIGLFSCLIACWVWSEYKINNPSTRVALGGAAILVLCAALYASELRNFYHDAHNSAAIYLKCPLIRIVIRVEAIDDHRNATLII